MNLFYRSVNHQSQKNIHEYSLLEFLTIYKHEVTVYLKKNVISVSKIQNLNIFNINQHNLEYYMYLPYVYIFTDARLHDYM